MSRDGRREVYASGKPVPDSGLVFPPCFCPLSSEQAASKTVWDITFTKVTTFLSFWVNKTALATRLTKTWEEKGFERVEWADANITLKYCCFLQCIDTSNINKKRDEDVARHKGMVTDDTPTPPLSFQRWVNDSVFV